MVLGKKVEVTQVEKYTRTINVRLSTEKGTHQQTKRNKERGLTGFKHKKERDR